MRRLPTWVVYLSGLIPLGWIVYLTLYGGIGVDPVKGIEHRLGKVALWFLVGGLTITPVRRVVNLVKFRRAIGLLGFFYLTLHLIAWLWFDMGLMLSQAFADLFKRPYLTYGIIAFLLLIPLAITSNNASIRKLGGKWRRLHMLVYPAVALGVVHYLMQMKVISNEGWIWLAVLVVLLSLRWRKLIAVFPRRG
jgi:sulfoxide reductase heme-binding subunit YedZ